VPWVNWETAVGDQALCSVKQIEGYFEGLDLPPDLSLPEPDVPSFPSDLDLSPPELELGRPEDDFLTAELNPPVNHLQYQVLAF